MKTKAFLKDGELYTENGNKIKLLHNLLSGVVNIYYEAWINEENKLHRLDGPSLIYPNGCKEWYLNGLLHRIDGPAVEFHTGFKQYFINGWNYPEDEFFKESILNDIDIIIFSLL